MDRTRKSTLAALAAGAVVVVVAGAGAAVAATRGDTPQQARQTELNDAAKELGVAPAKLREALENVLERRVDAAVADGRLTRGQGDELKARIAAGNFPLLMPLLHVGRGHAHGPATRFAKLEAAASYLGVDRAELRQALRSGKSLADVARQNGKSVDGLVAALTKEATERLDAAVAAGRLTDAQRDELSSRLEERIRSFVNRTFERGRWGRCGPGQWRGPAARDAAPANPTF